MRYAILQANGEEISINKVDYDSKKLCFISGTTKIKASNADFICFFDSKCELSESFFKCADDAFESSQAAALLCRTAPCDTEIYYNPVTLEAPVLSGAFIVRTADYISAGGLDKRLCGQAAFTDLSLRLRAMGKRLLYCAGAAVYTIEEAREESFAYNLYGRLLICIKYNGFRQICLKTGEYIKALKNPPHYAGVRKELAACLLKAAGRFFPLYFYRLMHKKTQKQAAQLLNAFVFERRGAYKVNALQNKPLVSVIVRTCRRPEILREALITLRAQTYNGLEILVCEDNEPSAEQMISAEFADLNIKYICPKEHVGRSRNGNAGLKAASGEWLMLLDDDDLLYPEHIEALLSEAESKPDARLILSSAAALYCRLEYGERVAEGLRPMVFDRIDIFTMCQSCRIPLQTALFKKKLFLECGGFHDGLNAHEDWAMWLKFLAKKPRGQSRGADIERITSYFVQPADNEQAALRLAGYSAENSAFFSDEALCFNVSLADMRGYYKDILADIEHLQGLGKLEEFLKSEKAKYL